jgi:Polyketide synthase modules and related proteins
MRAEPIAVIGMSLRLPGADTPDQFWRNLSSGQESISPTDVPSSAVNHVPYAAFPNHIEEFDADFFGFSATDAEVLDPQQRLFLECAWEVFENAAYDPTTYAGKIGVYASCSINTYLLCNLLPHPKYSDDSRLFGLVLNSNPDFLATRVSYKLNLRGPSYTTQSACSSSLVALHLACQGLTTGDCDMAIAGGVALNMKIRRGYTYVDGGIFSSDGTCRPFDANATGTVFGNGAALVLLKPLEKALADRDTISAIILGSAVNNDGASKVGYMAPSVYGQASVIEEAVKRASVHPETISYIEAHGTGTAIGDPIEVAALTKAFRKYTDRIGYCAIGSVKSNIGHLDAAAGIAGVLKTVLSLKQQFLVPSLHFNNINPEINMEASPFRVNTRLTEWPAGNGPRRAGVSAFGVGGTNAHAIFEEAPHCHESPPSTSANLIPISARSPSALKQNRINLTEWLEDHLDTSVGSFAYTLQHGRKSFPFRQYVVARNTSELLALLRLEDDPVYEVKSDAYSQPLVCFLLPGWSSSSPKDTEDLYRRSTIFKATVDMAAALCLPSLGYAFSQQIYADSFCSSFEEYNADNPIASLSAWFSINLAYAKLWIEQGVSPSALLGNGLGELSAAVLAEVMDLPTALNMVKAMATHLDNSAEHQTASLLGDRILIDNELRRHPQVELLGAISPTHMVVTGTSPDMALFERECQSLDIRMKRQKIGLRFRESIELKNEITSFLSGVQLSRPSIPFVSSANGRWISNEEAISPLYWATQVTRPTMLDTSIDCVTSRCRVFIEVGIGDMLTKLVYRHPSRATHRTISVSSWKVGQPSWESYLLAAGSLWANGIECQRISLTPSEGHRIPLPTYPFERSKYWIEGLPRGTTPGGAQGNMDKETKPFHPRPLLQNPYIEPRDPTEVRLCQIWSDILGITPIGATDNFFDLGGDSLIGIEVVEKLKHEFSVEISPVDLFETVTVRELAGSLSPLMAAHRP